MGTRTIYSPRLALAATLLPILLATLLLAACGGSGSRASSPSPPSQTPSGAPLSSPAPMPAAVATCPAGATPDVPGPADQARPELNEPAGVAMDSRSGRVVAFDAGSATTWTFDVCTNTWQRMRSAQEPALGRWARLVYDARADLTIAFPIDGYAPCTYSVEADEWTQLPASASSPDTSSLSDLVYDPVSGQVLLRDSQTTELWSYAVATNTWTKVEQGGDMPAENPNQQDGEPHFHSLLSYDSFADRLVLTLLGDAGETWSFAPRAGAWTKQKSAPPTLNTGYFESGGEAVFDTARGLTVVFSDGVVATYDAAADEWTKVAPGPGWPDMEMVDDMPTGPLARLGHWLVYDPVNERIVMFGGHARMLEDNGNIVWRDLDDVWAYDLSTNSWVELVSARPK